MKFAKGTKFKYQYENEQDTLTVIGSRLLRKQYIYIIQDSKGERSSLTRNQVLDAIERGVLKVI